MNETWETKYLHALYFSVITMVTVGFGDIVPSNNLEVGVCIITVMISCGVYAYTINAIGIIFQEADRHNKVIEKNKQIINDYMEKK